MSRTSGVVGELVGSYTSARAIRPEGNKVPWKCCRQKSELDQICPSA